METQVLAEFQLKITLIGEAIDNNVILPQIWTIFRHSLAQIVSKIAKFEKLSKFPDLNHGNTSTGRVLAKNYPNWGSYCQKVILPQIWPIYDLLWPKFRPK